jgi:CBS domain-containing protein
VLTVEPDASLDDVLEILASDDREVNRVPVVEGESLVGLVTRQDLLGRSTRNAAANDPPARANRPRRRQDASGFESVNLLAGGFSA